MLLLAVRRLREYKLKERYTLIFLFIGTPFLILALWPDAVSTIAKELGMQNSTLMILCVCAFLLLVVMELLTIVSIQDRKISSLAQMVGILMARDEHTADLPSPRLRMDHRPMLKQTSDQSPANPINL